MPRTTFQRFIFTLLMTFVMVYTMICYNMSLVMGGMQNAIFIEAFAEMRIMWPVAFILEWFVVEKPSQAIAFRIVTPGKDKPFQVILTLSCAIVCLMCPLMSLVATFLFKNAGIQVVAVWLQTTFMNFPVALFWQLVIAGPLVRFLFGKIFADRESERETVAEA